MRSRFTFAVIGLVVVFLLAFVVLVAVRSSGGGGGGSSGGKSTASNKAASGKGNEFTLLGADPPTLDPALSGDATSAEYIVHIFSGLVTINRQLEVEPDIAERWDVSPDGKIYTFYLRSGVKFHNGREVTAHDFKYSIERAADPATESTTADAYLGDIVGVKDKLSGKRKDVPGVRVIDDRTLEITIDAPKPYFLAKLTFPAAFVLDEATVKGKRTWTNNPNGTGPFKLGEWKKGEKLVLVSNENYYRGAPKVARVNFNLAGGSSMTMYENNEIDVTGVSLDDIERVLDPKDPLNKQLVTATTLDTFYVGFNNQMPPFDDVKVRQAFSYAVDKDAIIKTVLLGLYERADGILPPSMPGYNPNIKGLAYDPAKAKSLI
ncbi:MAG: peptide ABC transporter substrate-binding protein, partial [Chloroflexi bacterium]|nr:peptide ABC transporter substrate-binding protein [Chloroflexota bacterium]